uniref:XRRM domain-containing protein n=1 Tax=Rhinopithecus roxellana TaxID=61622 RepID=A0A2K6NBX5_RHIRO
ITENGDNEKMAALEAKICQQIEYYFGDFRLPRDKLNRLTTDFNVIVEALSKSKAELMEISEDKTKIRRSPSKPLREVTDESVYIKGFPTDANLDGMKEWLEDKDQVLNIQMRRTVIESAKKFVETTGQKYKDTDLIILFKDDHFAKKINEERKQNKVEAKLRAKQEQEAKQKLEDAEMKSLEEKIGCLLKFSGDLDDQTCREELHILFSNHGEMKWIDFIRGAKEGIILFKEKVKETLDKAKDANNGNLQLRNKEVTWEVLEGEVAKEALKKIIEDQQEFLNKWKSKGCRFKGKGKGNKAAQAGSGKGKVQFQSKKTKFASDDAHDENGAVGPMKRAREETDKEEPASKQPKTENGAGDQ